MCACCRNATDIRGMNIEMRIDLVHVARRQLKLADLNFNALFRVHGYCHVGGPSTRAVFFLVSMMISSPASSQGMLESSLMDFDSSTDSVCLIGQAGAMLDRLKYDCRQTMSELESRIIEKSATKKAKPCFDNINNRWPDFIIWQGGKPGACRYFRTQMDDWLRK